MYYAFIVSSEKRTERSLRSPDVVNETKHLKNILIIKIHQSGIIFPWLTCYNVVILPANLTESLHTVSEFTLTTSINIRGILRR